MRKTRSTRELIEAGKQVGAEIQFDLDGSPCWSSVAVQKWEGGYLVYVYEILESKMVAEEYERDEVRELASLDEASSYINAQTQARFDEMRPCKGQRMFNPEVVKR